MFCRLLLRYERPFSRPACTIFELIYGGPAAFSYFSTLKLNIIAYPGFLSQISLAKYL
jgi:hypothetical protein